MTKQGPREESVRNRQASAITIAMADQEAPSDIQARGDENTRIGEREMNADVPQDSSTSLHGPRPRSSRREISDRPHDRFSIILRDDIATDVILAPLREERAGGTKRSRSDFTSRARATEKHFLAMENLAKFEEILF
uniref:Uncharacterized protein n=1 Tax=Pseudictyota dubia TaxID=2749911 RepID=A0A7R9VBH8_9STRA|mmetsp:Transcript_10005/g.19074  ORF Transcript_10005/g.19074 Transcript_10005/m.19074 type:complete len:137 (+) Transcript_10005:433-843(+)